MGRMNRSLSCLFAAAVALGLGLYHLEVATTRLLPRVGLQPWLIGHGFGCFRDIIDQHEAGLPLFLSLLLPFFSDAPALSRWMLAGLSATCVILVHMAAPPRWAPLAVVFFACWAPVVWGDRLWYETALAPLYVAAYLAWRGDSTTKFWRVAVSGVLLGVAVTVKQYAWALVGFYVFWPAAVGHLRGEARCSTRRLCAFVAGVAVPAAIYLASIARNDSFSDYLFWAWVNNLTTYRDQAAQWPDRHGIVISAALLLPALSAFAYSLRGLWRGGEKVQCLCVLSFGSLLASATIYPRFEVFHFGAALPLLAVTIAATLDVAVSRRLNSRHPDRRGWPRAGLAAAVAVSLVLSLWVLVPRATRMAHLGPRRTKSYSELVPVADRVREWTRPADRILVFPDVEPTSNLYLLSERLPPGLWAYTYPRYSSDAVLDRIVRALETRRPPLVVYFPDLSAGGHDPAEFAARLKGYILHRYAERETLQTDLGVATIMLRR